MAKGTFIKDVTQHLREGVNAILALALQAYFSDVIYEWSLIAKLLSFLVNAGGSKQV